MSTSLFNGLILFVALISAAGGQDRAQQWSFEVASIKPHGPNPIASVAGPGPGELPGISISGLRVELRNLLLADWIAIAYRVPVNRISGGPGWVSSEKFDLAAKMPDGASALLMPEMLQALLSTRFALTLHRVTREAAAYALVSAGGSVRLKRTDPAGGSKPDGAPASSVSQGGVFHIEHKNITLSRLAEILSQFVGEPVVDFTNLDGNYDIVLDVRAMDMPRMARFTRRDPLDSVPGPSIFNSVEKLGLKLERRKLPIEFLIIDSVNRPTEN